MHNASTAADCAEMQRLSKIGCFLHFGETGDSPDTFIFYFQHNKSTCKHIRRHSLTLRALMNDIFRETGNNRDFTIKPCFQESESSAWD